jgi:ankyrin repeat protein
MRPAGLACAGVYLLLTAASAAPAAEAVLPERLRPAAERALTLLAETSAAWPAKRTCTSCHHQTIPAFAFEAAHRKGLRFDEARTIEGLRKGFGPIVDIDRAVQATRQIDPSMDTGLMLAAAAALGAPGNGGTTAFARLLLLKQQPSGSWTTIDARPPQSYSTIGATAYAARAVQAYAGAGSREWTAKADAAVARARTWLSTAPAFDTADLVYRVIGLSWTRGTPSELEDAVRAVRSAQHADGGWGQLPGLASDAYSTASAVAALQESGVASSDDTIARGLKFLVDTQRPDGSWHVASRVTEQDLVSPPHFETGFPHGPDQMISAMATAYAIAAIAGALPAKGDSPLVPSSAWHTDEPAWVRVVQSGTLEELAALLDKGLLPDAATEGGTSLLMIAAPDVAKMRLLVERGADVNRAAASGVTPLMVAANYPRSAEALRFLLARGAQAMLPKAAVNESTPTSYAIWSGDTEALEAILAAGGRIPEHVNIAGGLSYVSALDIAAFQRDEPMIRALVRHGQDVNGLDESGVSPLTQAALMNDAALVRLLVSLGADPNRPDQNGETPLMHAAQMDYGTTDVIKALLAAGACRTALDKDGRTALELAKRLEYTAIVAALETVPASR